MRKIFLFAAVIVATVSCNGSRKITSTLTDSGNAIHYRVNVEEVSDHSVSRYTQGLFFEGDFLYETAGQYGESALYKTDFSTGKLLEKISFPDKYFLEGSCILNGKIYVLTWQEKQCFVFDANTLNQEQTFSYSGEGWGLTTDGESLIMSDGSSTLFFRNPETFAIKSKIPVTYKGQSVNYLNELEYIDGKIWANVYTTDTILIINPLNGVVEGLIDCKNLLDAKDMDDNTDVLNGIAYNPADGSIYLTGKRWPKMFKITIK